MVAKLLADAGLAPEAGLGAALGAVLCGSQQAAAGGGGGGGASVVTLPEKREALVTVLAALARQRPLLLCVEE